MAAQKVLNGVKVVELATVIAAPAAATVLADFGADVIKVEAPDGDYFRQEAISLQRHHPHGPLFENVNRGKRSVVVDLKKGGGVATLKKLIADADVFVTNVREAALQRLGLDYESLRAEYPRLIYGHLTAWGRTGPNKDKPGYDAGAFFAATGMQDLLRANEESPPPRYPPGFGDLTASTQLVSGIALALYHREKTGKGQMVDTSLYHAGIWLLSCPLTMYQVPGKGKLSAKTARGGRQMTWNPVFNTYQTKDGRWIQLLGLEVHRHLPGVLRATGLEESCKADPRFMNVKECLRNRNQLVSVLDARFKEADLNEWQRRLDEAGVWYSLTTRYEEVPSDPQSAPCFAKVPGVGHPLVTAPFQLSSHSHKPECGAPRLGEHTAQVLDELRARL